MAKKRPAPTGPVPNDPVPIPPILIPPVTEGEELGDYDETARYLARLDGKGLFEWLLRGTMSDFDFVEWMDSRLTTAPTLRFKRTGDLRARLRHRHSAHRDCSMQLESQTRSELGYIERLMEYQGIFQRQMSQEGLSDQLAAFTIYLTGDGPAMVDTGHDGIPFGARMDSGVKALKNEDAGTVLAEIRAGSTARVISAFTPLMKRGSDPAIIEECKEVMAGAPEAALRADYAAAAIALAPLAGCRKQWQTHFKGWNMEQSPFLRSWMDRAARAGFRRGNEQGIETGRQQTVHREVIDHREMLERILKRRFTKQVDESVLARLANEPNLDVLKSWTEQVAVAKSWKAFCDAAGWD